MRPVPLSAMASRTLSVPVTLTCWLIRSSGLGVLAHAKWATTSAPAIARLTAPASRMSAATNSAALDQLWGRWRAIPTTSCPMLSNRAARPRPSTPLAPVTAILTDWPQSRVLVIVQQCHVDQVVEVHVRDVPLRGFRGDCRLPDAFGFGSQCEQQVQHSRLP